jgi:hypothetical protein
MILPVSASTPPQKLSGVGNLRIGPDASPRTWKMPFIGLFS